MPGLLTGPPPDGYYKEWLENAKRQGVPPSVIVDIARRHDITPEDFDVLDGMEKITDRDGKSFFLMPPGTSGDDARKAALMTYILNAGTDYGEATRQEGLRRNPLLRQRDCSGSSTGRRRIPGVTTGTSHSSRATVAGWRRRRTAC